MLFTGLVFPTRRGQYFQEPIKAFFLICKSEAQPNPVGGNTNLWSRKKSQVFSIRLWSLRLKEKAVGFNPKMESSFLQSSVAQRWCHTVGQVEFCSQVSATKSPTVSLDFGESRGLTQVHPQNLFDNKPSLACSISDLETILYLFS